MLKISTTEQLSDFITMEMPKPGFDLRKMLMVWQFIVTLMLERGC